MENKNMFERATREKLRFPYKGVVTVEDLWGLTPRQLDGVYKELRGKQKEAEGDSLLKTKSVADTELDLQIEIIKYIVEVKEKESDSKEKALLRQVKKREIQEALREQESNVLKGSTPEQLREMLKELEREE